MYRMAFRALCLLVLTGLILAPGTKAFSQSSAPPQIEAVIRALQSGDRQALRGVLAPRLYRIVLARPLPHPNLQVLGEVESVTARRIGADRRTGVATYDVSVRHRNGTSHWILRAVADGRRVIVVAFRMDARQVATAAPSGGGESKHSARRSMKNGHEGTERSIVMAPNTVPAAPAPSPSGRKGETAAPMAAPAPPRPSMLPPALPPPRSDHLMVGAAPPPPARVDRAPGPRGPTAAPSRPTISAAPPAANGSSSAPADPSAMRRINPATPPRVDGPGTPRAPDARTDIPVFPGTRPTPSGPPIDITRAPPPPAGAPMAPSTTPTPAEQRVVDFLFATSRERDTSVETIAFTGERAERLSFGAASIRIPEEHKVGEITLPSVWRIWGFTLSEEKPDEQKHFTVRALKVLTADEWSAAINTKNPKSALIFVHGYNTTFEDALYRNAQLGRDGFIEVLRILKEKHGIESVNVIAHSMGNQVVLDALSSYARTTNPATIGELILAAPDVDRQMFTHYIPEVQKIVKGITLYASSADKAMAASRQLAGKLRAGDIGDEGPIILKNMETIDVTAMGEEMLGLNHNVFAASRNLIDDINLILTKGTRPPDQRLRQILPFPDPPNTPRYWRYAH